MVLRLLLVLDVLHLQRRLLLLELVVHGRLDLRGEGHVADEHGLELHVASPDRRFDAVGDLLLDELPLRRVDLLGPEAAHDLPRFGAERRADQDAVVVLAHLAIERDDVAADDVVANRRIENDAQTVRREHVERLFLLLRPDAVGGRRVVDAEVIVAGLQGCPRGAVRRVDDGHLAGADSHECGAAGRTDCTGDDKERDEAAPKLTVLGPWDLSLSLSRWLRAEDIAMAVPVRPLRAHRKDVRSHEALDGE